MAKTTTVNVKAGQGVDIHLEDTNGLTRKWTGVRPVRSVKREARALDAKIKDIRKESRQAALAELREEAGDPELQAELVLLMQLAELDDDQEDRLTRLTCDLINVLSEQVSENSSPLGDYLYERYEGDEVTAGDISDIADRVWSALGKRSAS